MVTCNCETLIGRKVTVPEDGHAGVIVGYHVSSGVTGTSMDVIILTDKGRLDIHKYSDVVVDLTCSVPSTRTSSRKKQ